MVASVAQGPATSMVSTTMPCSQSGARALTSWRCSSHWSVIEAVCFGALLLNDVHGGFNECRFTFIEHDEHAVGLFKVPRRLRWVVEAQHRRAGVTLKNAPTGFQTLVKAGKAVGGTFVEGWFPAHHQRGASDDAERSFRTDEELHQVGSDGLTGSAVA